MPPDERLEAACRAAGAGDIEAVREWLASADDVNALNVAEPAFGVAGRYGRNSTVLGSCTAKISETIDYEDVDYEAKTAQLASLKVEIVRLLLDSGADPNLGLASEYSYSTPLLNTMEGCCNLMEGCWDPVAHILDMAVLLLDAGARVNTRNDANEYTGIYDTPLGCALSSLGPESPHGIKFVSILLQAGASLDDCGGDVYAEEMYSAEHQVTRREIPYHDPDGVIPPHERESWDECKALIAGVRAAGSWKAFDRVPRKAVIRLRSLYTRGRATTADPVMKFLCELGDNGVVWNVLSFWRARLY